MKKDEIINDLELIRSRLQEIDEVIHCTNDNTVCEYCSNSILCYMIDRAEHSLYLAIDYLKYH